MLTGRGDTMKFKTIAATLLAFSSVAATAATYTLPTDGITVYTAAVNSSTFADVFNFSVPTTSTFDGGVAGMPGIAQVSGKWQLLAPLSFTSIGLTAISPGSVASGFNWSYDTLSSMISFSAASLTSGSYSLNVSGFAPGNTGSYQISSLLAPVPEPETYAMFMAGLGLMGFMTRRRSIK